MAVEILYQGRKPGEWRYFHCGMCGTVWRDGCDINGATYIIMSCPTCGVSCADISREEALGYVPSGQCLIKED